VKERAVADLRNLAAADEDLAGRAGRLEDLDAQVASIRTAAEAVDAFFAAYPSEEERRRAAVEAAEAELARRQEEKRTADEQLAAAGDEDERERARHVVDRAVDHVAVAETALARARGSADELERDAARLPNEVPLLEERARAVASAVPALPEVPSGPRALVEWASHAHAELFVAVRHLDAQRDRVIREANELATMLLGEPTYGSTVAQLAERVLPLAGE
jgi:chromosome segregation ATPase